MKTDDAQLDQALALLSRPELPAELSAHVRRIALSEVEPKSAAGGSQLLSVAGGLLIPAMLSSAAIVCAVDTVEVAKAAFSGGREET